MVVTGGFWDRFVKVFENIFNLFVYSNLTSVETITVLSVLDTANIFRTPIVFFHLNFKINACFATNYIYVTSTDTLALETHPFCSSQKIC